MTVTEKRAPTEESVKLLRELEEAAEKKYFANFKLEANGFTAHVFAREDFRNLEIAFVVLFELNGVDHEVRTSSPKFKGRDEILNGLWTAVSKYIAGNILSGADLVPKHFMDMIR